MDNFKILKGVTTKETADGFKQLTKHHLTPISQGGCDQDYNLFTLRWRKHRRWHNLFGVMVLEEIILLLTELSEAIQSGRPPQNSHHIDIKVLGNVFAGGRQKKIQDIQRVIATLKRIKRMKGRF